METTLPPDLQNEIGTLLSSLEGLERARYLSIAALVCVLYDMMLTMDDEVRVPVCGYLGWHADRSSATADRILLEGLLDAVALSVLFGELLAGAATFSGSRFAESLCSACCVNVRRLIVVGGLCGY